MSFLDHIARCNAHDLSDFTPFSVDGKTVGHIRKENLVHLERFPEVFKLSDGRVDLADGLDDYDWDEDMLFGSKPPPLQVLGAYSGARRS